MSDSSIAEQANMLFNPLVTAIISLAIIKLISETVDKLFIYINERDKRNALLKFNELDGLQESAKREPGRKTSGGYRIEDRGKNGFCIHIHGKEISLEQDQCDSDNSNSGKDLNNAYHCSHSGSIPSATSSARSSISHMSHEEKIQAVQDEISKIVEGDYSSIESVS